ncbi:DUF397 domain-containing protein [Streptomyces sp. NPDC048603]|uniref:DUF397 domain-containing protein n=1 Tax=Streptomyces sp. NPDC048603 TaxID=3365577 RepID=UPI003717EFFB
MSQHTWQKSSYCAAGDSCIHVRSTRKGLVQLTESSDPTGAVLTTSPNRFTTLLREIKEGMGPRPDETGMVRVREDGITVTTTATQWAAFAAGVRAGQFDHFVRHDLAVSP